MALLGAQIGLVADDCEGDGIGALEEGRFSLAVWIGDWGLGLVGRYMCLCIVAVCDVAARRCARAWNRGLVVV